jgi:hypothetical protein
MAAKMGLAGPKKKLIGTRSRKRFSRSVQLLQLCQDYMGAVLCVCVYVCVCCVCMVCGVCVCVCVCVGV